MSLTPIDAPRIQLGGPAPDFEAKTTHGLLKLSEWNKEKWVVLFSHPADFTPVCTTEFLAFAGLESAFAERNTVLIGLSIDSVFAHIGWVQNIKEKFGVDVNFPIIADLDQRVASLYGMVHTPSSETATVRCVFIIDPARKIRALIYYPMNVGRNFAEIIRLIDGLQTADKNGVACPANWVPGEPVIVPAPQTVAGARERLASQDYQVTDWYFSKKTL